MKEQYKITILDDREFNNLHKKLPYVSEEKLREGLGFAHQNTHEAYIRRTGVEELDEATIMHEVEELLAVVSPHEEDNIRWKKWGKPFRAMFGNEEQKAAQQGTTFGNVLGGGGGWGALGALGSLALAPFTAGTSLAGLTSMAPMATLAGALQGGIEGKGLKSALLGALKGYGAGNIVSGGAGAVSGAQAGTGAMKGAMSGLGNYGINPAIGKALGLGATTNVNPASGLQGPATLSQSKLGYDTLAQVPMNLVGSRAADVALGALGTSLTPKPPVPTPQITSPVPAAITPPAATPPAAPPATGLGATLGKVGKTLATPLGTMAIGTALTGMSALPKNAEFEKVASLEQLRNEISSKGASPALYTRARRALEENYQDANEELDTVYNQAGMIDSGEYRDAKAKMMAKKADAEELLAAQIDEGTMNELLGLTNLDVNLAAMKYGADSQDIAQLRQLLGMSGGTMLSTGLSKLFPKE